MLILSRKVGERILIGDDIEVLISSISGSQVKVGIEAPKSIVILRDELAPHNTRKDEEIGVDSK